MDGLLRCHRLTRTSPLKITIEHRLLSVKYKNSVYTAKVTYVRHAECTAVCVMYVARMCSVLLAILHITISLSTAILSIVVKLYL